jgi:uncharacterized membrane protein YkvA (DUF1232 family)
VSHDPFPRDRVAATLRRLPAYLKLAWRLARDPLLSRARRAAVVAAAGYLASPIDLVPGVIPVVGQLDDIAVALGALKFALAGLDGDRRREHLSAVGLEDGDLSEDLRTVGATTAWLVRAGARTTGRVARKGGSLALSGVRIAARATATAARATAEKGTSAAKAAPSATRSAGSRVGPAARSTAGKVVGGAGAAARRGASAVKGIGRRTNAEDVDVTERRPPERGRGVRPDDERLVIEPDTSAEEATPTERDTSGGA